ncbi:MAG: acyl-CoA thioesterase [Thermoanaerobaculia bacterium]
MADPVRHEVEVEVRYAETDQMGVVHHSQYVVWFELARTHLCALSGITYAEIERLGWMLMVTAVEVRYRKSARYGETPRIGCWIERLGSRGLRFAYDVRRNGELLVSGATEHVWIDRATGKPCFTPEPLREPFRRLAGVGTARM